MKVRRGVFPAQPYDVTENIPGRPTRRLATEATTPAPSEGMTRFAVIYRPHTRYRPHNGEV